MPEADKEGKHYYQDIPAKCEGFFLKGSNSLDWGMKNRLSQIFNPQSGRTVMLAVDTVISKGRPPVLNVST